MRTGRLHRSTALRHDIQNLEMLDTSSESTVNTLHATDKNQMKRQVRVCHITRVQQCVSRRQTHSAGYIISCRYTMIRSWGLSITDLFNHDLITSLHNNMSIFEDILG